MLSEAVLLEYKVADTSMDPNLKLLPEQGELIVNWKTKKGIGS